MSKLALDKMSRIRKASMILSLVFLTSIVNIQSQPAPCNDDIHCSTGFFCHTVSHMCHECLSCELMKRHPAPRDIDCIKSEKQCGPCYQGLVNDEVHWGGMCMSPDQKNVKLLTSYIYLLVTCIATGVLLSIFIMHGIYNTHVIKVKIAIPSHEMTSKLPNSEKHLTGTA